MDKYLENHRELFRTLNRLNNTNKGLLLKGDIERLERAKELLGSQESNEPRVTRSHENSGLNIADVTRMLRELLMRKKMLFPETPEDLEWYEGENQQLQLQELFIRISKALNLGNCG